MLFKRYPKCSSHYQDNILMKKWLWINLKVIKPKLIRWNITEMSFYVLSEFLNEQFHQVPQMTKSVSLFL